MYSAGNMWYLANGTFQKQLFEMFKGHDIALLQEGAPTPNTSGRFPRLHTR